MRRINCIILAAAALFSGCAATVSRDKQSTKAIAASPIAAKNILMEVTAVGNIGKGEDWDAFLEEWQTSMTAAAIGQGATFSLLKSGATSKSDAAVLVQMKVNDFKYVSQAKRYGIGVFAGNAFMDVEVEFLEFPLRKSLGTRKYQTSSSAWQGVFSAMTPKQVEAVSKEIVAEVAGK